MSMGEGKSFGKGIVYGFTVVPLLVTLGYYFLEHVPSREEYFLNLRFRTLGVIGRQIETKLEAVSSGLTYGLRIQGVDQAIGGGPPQAIGLEEYLEKYVKRVFPGLQPAEGQVGRAKKVAANAVAVDPDIEFIRSADRVRFSVTPAARKWEDSLARLIRPLTEDSSFDDVLLAEPDGVVLFQRSDSTPKVRDISELLKKPDAKDEGALQFFHRLHSEGKGSDADLLREADLDGSGYRFLAEPLTIRVPQSPEGKVKELLIGGLVHAETVRREAMHVPPKYLLWIIVPLFAGVLSGPLLKLVLNRRTGRFETRDVPLMALFSCLAMAMLTVVPLAIHLSDRNDEELERSSQLLAKNVADQVLECFGRGRAVLRQVDTFAKRRDQSLQGPHLAMNRTKVWSWDEFTRAAPAVERIIPEFVYWTSQDGFQIEKWTPLEMNTPFYPQQAQPHYRQAVSGQFWVATADPTTPFIAQLLISPTTATPIAVLTIQSARDQELKVSAHRQAIEMVPGVLKPRLVSVVETPRNLLSPVIPPATGFALVERDGSVLYHSDHDRILNENFFRETENSSALREAVATQTKGSIKGRYRGSDVAFYVRPIHEVVGIPWTIVVFHEIEPWQTLVWQVGLDVLLLYALLWTLPVLAVPVGLLLLKWRRNCTWNECRIDTLRRFWPSPAHAKSYRVVAAIEGGLMAFFLIVLVWFTRRPDGAAGTALLVCALCLPAAALAVWVWRIPSLRMKRARVSGPQKGASAAAAPATKWRAFYIGSLCLTLVSSSVIPAIAFFHLAFRMESDIDTRRWQDDLAVRVLRHRAATQAEISEPGRYPDEVAPAALKLALPAAGDGRCDNEKLYEAWRDTTVHCGPAKLGQAAELFWRSALRYVRERAPAIGSGEVTSGSFDGVTRAGPLSAPVLAVPHAGEPTLVVLRSKLWDLPLLPRRIVCWLFGVIVLAAGSVWIWSAASRLFLFGFHEIPLRKLEELHLADWKYPILVLGLPRSGKDTAVKKFIQRIEKEQRGARLPLRARIDLKTDDLGDAWLEEALSRIGLKKPSTVDIRALGEAHTAVAAAAAGGDGVSVAASHESSAEDRIPDYVHVTNLEAAIQDREKRDIVMRLLDALVRAHSNRELKLVVTSVVDPSLHFDIIFPDQTEEMERSQLPETEFGRWAHVFLQFERVLVDEESRELKDAEAVCGSGSEPWRLELLEEGRHHRVLCHFVLLMAEAAKSAGHGPTKQSLVDELYERALALYKLLWSSCTRPEKLLLVQLAQTGLVNPICKDTLHDLKRKSLVVLKPYPAVMNESFTRFLQSAATRAQIRAWEEEAGESHWRTVRNILIILVAFAFLMIGISQNHALQSISGILTAVVGGIGGVFKLTETIAGRWARKVTAAPALEESGAPGE